MACAKLSFLILVLVCLSLSDVIVDANGCLETNYYASTCPSLFPIVKEGVKKAIMNESRVGASLLRMHFHDCFVNGCDGSVLLDDGPNFKSEKSAVPNNNSLRGFYVVDNIKAKVEQACPGVVSCADLLAIIARDSVAYYGGPTWDVRLGRRDSLIANQSGANTNLPPPKLNLDKLERNFSDQGLNFNDMVVLSGGHTVGFARCTIYKPHIYNDTNIDPAFAKSRQPNCPRNSTINDTTTLQPLDLQTRFVFDGKYYQNLLVKKGLMHSDQQLYNGNATSDALVQKYATDQCQFFKDFANSMIRMGNVNPLTGSKGEIRLNCHKPN